MTTKERPILFSAPMVRAILDGSKTQTRRIVKGLEPDMWLEETAVGGFNACWEGAPSCGTGVWNIPEYSSDIKCPHGQPGDRLWIREAWSFVFLGGHSGEGEVYQEFEVQYRAGGQSMTIERDHHDAGLVRLFDTQRGSWRPSIHMPRWASRILLEIVSVRVERLHDISDSDAYDEGTQQWASEVQKNGSKFSSIRTAWQGLWTAVNGAESWESNPWVWVVEFKRVLPCK